MIPFEGVRTSIQRYQYSKMSPEARAELADEIVAWGLGIWHSTAADLRGYYLEQKSYDTVIYVLRSGDGTLVGSATMKFYRVEFEGERNTVVVKLGLGVSPEHRGNKFALRCLMWELLRWKASHPRTPIYLFSTLIHPVTYKLCCDLLSDRLYPWFEHPENPAMQQKVEQLCALFGVEKARSPSPFVYVEKFSAIETREAIDYWRGNQRPEVRFYVEHCPDYYQSGDCLVALAKLDLGHVLTHMIRTLARNRLDKARGRKHRFQGGDQPLMPNAK